MIPLRVVKIIKTENRIGLPGARAGENGKLQALSDLQDEKSYGDGWWQGLHNKVNVLNTIELYT